MVVEDIEMEEAEEWEVPWHALFLRYQMVKTHYALSTNYQDVVGKSSFSKFISHEPQASHQLA